MKIYCVSDVHGFDMSAPGEFWERLPEGGCEVMVIAGDIFPLREERKPSDALRWMEDVFLPGVRKVMDRIGAVVCLMVPGNHDFLMETDFVPQAPWLKVLIGEGYEHNGIRFWGSPWWHRFGYQNWAFPLQDDRKVKEKLDEVPLETDVLICHVPPMGTFASMDFDTETCDVVDFGDRSLGEWLRGESWDGNCQVLVCGHNHEPIRRRFRQMGMEIVCCPLCDNDYARVNFGEVVEVQG